MLKLSLPKLQKLMKPLFKFKMPKTLMILVSRAFSQILKNKLTRFSIPNNPVKLLSKPKRKNRQKNPQKIKTIKNSLGSFTVNLAATKVSMASKLNLQLKRSIKKMGSY